MNLSPIVSRRSLAPAALFAALVALGIASRFAQDVCPWIPPNFHAVAGTALFAGFLFRSRAVACAVPLVTMLISDRWFGGYEMGVMIAVYGSLLVPALLGEWLARRLAPLRVVGASLVSSTLFFLVTNLAVWATWYPHTAAGFARCYLLALPFFGYTAAGDLVFACGLFGLYCLVASRTALVSRRAAAVSVRA